MNAQLISTAMLTLIVTVTGFAQSHVRAQLQPPKDRKAASDFSLTDAEGRTGDLKQYRGKVLLLDFWATWCSGCKQEIPWFDAFQRQFGAEHLAVVGVSLDEGGWGVLKPFLAKTPVPYRVLLGDQPTAKRYGIENLPDTFLIDKQGRVAAVYRAALVDKDDVEANIKALLSEQ
jgi:peroxiredoxin